MSFPPILLRATRLVRDRILSAVAEPRARKLLTRQEPPRPTPFAVYFADGPAGLYQLRQWIRPLEELAANVAPVAVVLRNAQVALALAAETQLPLVLATSSATVESFVDAHGVQALFYVNNNQANFTTLRLNGPAHVHLSHGESEKVSMVSNQLKAYDFAFIAGPAARDRILAHVPRFDAAHLVQIGRPQLDQVAGLARSGTDRTTVLYAPTWEGDSEGMAYGSVATHGVDLAARVLAEPTLRLIYRPHPKTGDLSPAYRQAHSGLVRAIKDAKGGHEVDTSPEPWNSLATADVVVSDISAMAIDAVGLNLPVVLCTTGSQAAQPASAPNRTDDVQPSPVAGNVRALADATVVWSNTVPQGAMADLKRLATEPPSSAQESYRRYVFGPGTGPGFDTARFVAEAAALLRS